MNEKIGIVWNPSKAEAAELREAFDAAMPEGGGPECLWFETTPEDPGQGAAGDALARGCTVVIAAGGDGTVRAVAERLGESGAPEADLGVVPLGTGNLLARNLDIPLGDPSGAFERAISGEARPLDLGEVRFRTEGGAEERRGFVVMVGFGLDAQMIVETDDELKARAGWLAYVESLGRAAQSTKIIEAVLRLDGGDPSPASVHTLLIANCGSIQGGITLLPDATPDDGELDLLLLSADNAGSWLDTMKNLVWDNGLKRLVSGAGTGAGPAESSDSTRHLRAREVRVELPEPRVFEIDGDEVGAVSAFEVRVLPAALRVR